MARRNDHPSVFDYKDFKTLQRYVNQFGRIESRKKTGLSEKQQKQLARAVKKARHLALLPFVVKQSMYGITDLKKGTLIDLDGTPFQVVDYAQKQMGRGGSIVNVKIKSLTDGRVLDKTFKGSEKISAAQVDRKKAQYLYADDREAHFMDGDTYEQFAVSVDAAGDKLQFLPEGATAEIQLYEGRAIGLELPVKVPLKVTEAPAAVKGDTQSTVQKEVTLETGTKIQAPIFIKTGDTLIVDTRDGSYVERAKE